MPGTQVLVKQEFFITYKAKNSNEKKKNVQTNDCENSIRGSSSSAEVVSKLQR